MPASSVSIDDSADRQSSDEELCNAVQRLLGVARPKLLMPLARLAPWAGVRSIGHGMYLDYEIVGLIKERGVC